MTLRSPQASCGGTSWSHHCPPHKQLLQRLPDVTDAEMHAAMAAEYEKQGQALADDKRRHNHFQCRLDQETGDKLRHFLKDRNISANEALGIMIRQFFEVGK